MAIDCTAKIAARFQDPCDSTREGARIVALAYLKKGQWATISAGDPDAATLTASLLSEEQSGNAYIIRNTTGELAETQNTVDGRGLQKTKSTTLDHSATVVDHEPVRNTGFWDNIKDTANDWDVLVFTQTRGWQDVNQSINIESTMVIADNLDEYVKINSVTNWTSSNHLTAFDYVEATLNAYPDAGAVTLTANGSGTVGGASPDFTYDVLDAGGVDIGVALTSGADVLKLELAKGSLPTGISISGSSLVGTATGTGVTVFSICVVNIYGLETVVEITYTVS